VADVPEDLDEAILEETNARLQSIDATSRETAADCLAAVEAELGTKAAGLEIVPVTALGGAHRVRKAEPSNAADEQEPGSAKPPAAPPVSPPMGQLEEAGEKELAWLREQLSLAGGQIAETLGRLPPQALHNPNPIFFHLRMPPAVARLLLEVMAKV
jgi:hypothetical protein